MSDKFSAMPGTFCSDAGHDGMDLGAHWEAHSISIEDLIEEKKAAEEKGFKTLDRPPE